MSSHFAWIDFSDTERQRMMDVIRLFHQQDTRDELGIGSIRDAFANHFFPGTSTVQTRARYMLFIRGLRALEKKMVPSHGLQKLPERRAETHMVFATPTHQRVILTLAMISGCRVPSTGQA